MTAKGQGWEEGTKLQRGTGNLGGVTNTVYVLTIVGIPQLDTFVKTHQPIQNGDFYQMQIILQFEV